MGGPVAQLQVEQVREGEFGGLHYLKYYLYYYISINGCGIDQAVQAFIDDH